MRLKGRRRRNSLTFVAFSTLLNFFRVKIVKKRFQSLPIVGRGQSRGRRGKGAFSREIEGTKKREIYIYIRRQVPVYSYKISVQIVKSVHKSRVRCHVARDRSICARTGIATCATSLEFHCQNSVFFSEFIRINYGNCTCYL